MIPAKEEGNVVSEMKLEEGCVVHVMGKPAAGGGSNDAAAPAGATPAGATVNLGSAAASSASSSSTTVTAALARLAMSGGDTYRTALTTADKVLGNIVKNVSLFSLVPLRLVEAARVPCHGDFQCLDCLTSLATMSNTMWKIDRAKNYSRWRRSTAR